MLLETWTWVKAVLVALLLLGGCGGGGETVDTEGTLLPEAAVVAEMVFVVRVTGSGEDVRLEVPLPVPTANVQVLHEEFRLRGFSLEEVMRDDLRLAVLEHPNLEGRRRFTYKALIASDPVEHAVPAPERGAHLPPELRRHTLPTPRLQSRSPLVRERLIEPLEPRLAEEDTDLVRAIYGMVAAHFERRTAGGTNNVLRALREGHANDLGLDRLLVTFMRSAGIPARNVTGFKLRTDGGRKLERWTEVYVDGSWVPMSTSKGWYGVLPPRYLKMSHGERTLIERDGVERLSFKVLVRDPRPTVAAHALDDESEEVEP